MAKGAKVISSIGNFDRYLFMQIVKKGEIMVSSRLLFFRNVGYFSFAIYSYSATFIF